MKEIIEDFGIDPDPNITIEDRAAVTKGEIEDLCDRLTVLVKAIGTSREQGKALDKLEEFEMWALRAVQK